MRIVTFKAKDSTDKAHIGALLNGDAQILNFHKALDISSSRYTEIVDWLDVDGPLFSKAEAIYKEVTSNSKTSDIRSTAIINRNEVELIAPVPRPGKVVCVGLNYRDHAIETNQPIPETPIIFSKFTTAVIGTNQPVAIPSTTNKVDYEAELGVVIGRRAKDVSKERAFEYVLGYTNINDVSARDFQFGDKQWQRGKSCDTFCPMGEYIATKDEISDPHNLSIKLRLNGQTMQDSKTSQLIFDIPYLIAFLTASITLEPGDVIATGTPPGVGVARNPQVFIKAGDVMEVEVEGLGILSNPVK
jgi:acylpyruvate hydrolase